ncbi:hypothetical protein GUJ93_ZPchr0001g32000 [Zizania palustris]|uniref:Uncharacterized protein n=1 Tax=Zizania palustris TaxID=103762 RepID=A0A8J5RMP4_ZIZPA|nr:hypothetical protein GUJ93_ZPchr0001g32000 [Zizania palustris]
MPKRQACVRTRGKLPRRFARAGTETRNSGWHACSLNCEEPYGTELSVVTSSDKEVVCLHYEVGVLDDKATAIDGEDEDVDVARCGILLPFTCGLWHGAPPPIFYSRRCLLAPVVAIPVVGSCAVLQSCPPSVAQIYAQGALVVASHYQAHRSDTRLGLVARARHGARPGEHRGTGSGGRCQDTRQRWRRRCKWLQ